MRRADIEVPSEVVDMDSWTSPACYPRGSFCPVSHGPSTQYRGITKPCFRICSACTPCSQAPLCFTLYGWFPFSLREPLGASVTFWEATAPVKLPTWHGPPTG